VLLGLLASVSALTSSVAHGQSLGAVAKKERERRKENKEQGRKVLVFTEDELWPDEPEGEGESESENESEGGMETGGEETMEGSGDSSSGSRATGMSGGTLPAEYDESMEGEVPDFIPRDLSMADKIQVFQAMKRQYEQQVAQIDKAISDNETKIAELDRKIAEVSASGGAGLPVAPTGPGANQSQYTGQESETLLAERRKLETLTGNLRRQKEQLRMSLLDKGRTAGIPASYLRF
jgi:hypothetical protein